MGVEPIITFTQFEIDQIYLNPDIAFSMIHDKYEQQLITNKLMKEYEAKLK